MHCGFNVLNENDSLRVLKPHFYVHLHTGSANICFKELVYKVVTSAVFITTDTKTINTCKAWYALWF